VKGTKPRSCPSDRSMGANPHSPGLRRPQLGHASWFTPTSTPHDVQITDPEV